MRKILVMLIIISLFISGCSSIPSEPSNNQDINKNIESENAEKTVASDGDKEEIEVKENEIGKLTIFKKNEEVGAVQESGPFTVKVNKMQVSKLEVSEEYKSTFDNKDVVTIVTLEVEVENKSTETNTIYPDQGTIVTNTKEQKDAHLFLSGDVGGEYIGEVIKKENVIFALDSEAEEITSFKYIISRPIDSNWNNLGEDITFDLSFE